MSLQKRIHNSRFRINALILLSILALPFTIFSVHQQSSIQSQAATTSLAITVYLHGIGKGGDGANPSAGGNPNPLTQQQLFSVGVFNTQNALVASKVVPMTYNATNGNYTGAAAFDAIATGSYTVTVRADKYLQRNASGIQTITSGQTKQIAPIYLISGDIDVNNQINIIDYNVLMQCYADLTPAKNCSTQQKKLADLTDDGSVNQIDYNLFIREISNRSGEPGPTSPPTATRQPSSAPTNVPSPTPVANANNAGKAGAFWIHWNSTPVTDAMLAQEAKRRKVILLNAWESAYIPKLKAANPSILVFVYKDLSSTRSYACKNGVDDKDIPTGIGYCDANKNHPDWFLTSPSGGRFEYSGYGGHWQMDVGNPAYQDAWIANVKADLAAKKFDGVIMDNALFACDDYHKGTCPSKYPTNASMQNAYVAMLSKAKAQLNAAGFKTMANLNGARTHPGIWNKYMAHLDGGFDEFWLAFSSTNMLPAGGTEGWKAQVDEITFNESQGKITLVQPHFTQGDTRAFRYTFASYLMANGGNASYSEIAERDGYGNPPVYHPEFDWNLGAAQGAYTSIGSNLFRRDFKCGAVVVNANAMNSGAVTIQLGKAYTNENGASVTSVSLPGTSGSILRTPNCTP
jgi:hypothetical protein